MTYAQYQGILAALSNMSGAVTAYAGTALPSGWLRCDGTEYSRTDYAALFAAIGTVWGVGNGTTTFNVPDLRGRDVIGIGQGGGGLTLRTLGDTGGAESVSITSAMMPSHRHTVPIDSLGISVVPGNVSLQGSGDAADTTLNSGLTGGTDATPVMNPFAALAYIIKT